MLPRAGAFEEMESRQKRRVCSGAETRRNTPSRLGWLGPLASNARVFTSARRRLHRSGNELTYLARDQLGVRDEP